MNELAATPPTVVINSKSTTLHLQDCPTIRDRTVEPVFTNWSSNAVAIAVTSQNLHPCRGCKPIRHLSAWEHRHRPTAELAALTDTIGSHRFTTLDEDTLQAALAVLLGGRREVTLSMGGRVDILVGRIAVEVKVAGSAEQVFRQVQRYAHSPEVAGVLVVSTVFAHTVITGTVSGKPLRVAIARGGI